MNTVAHLKDLKLVLLLGGSSGEREVSLASGRTVGDTLRDGGYAFREIDPQLPGWWQELAGAEIAFNMLHGPGGEAGEILGLVRSVGVVCTGSGVLG